MKGLSSTIIIQRGLVITVHTYKPPYKARFHYKDYTVGSHNNYHLLTSLFIISLSIQYHMTLTSPSSDAPAVARSQRLQ